MKKFVTTEKDYAMYTKHDTERSGEIVITEIVTPGTRKVYFLDHDVEKVVTLAKIASGKLTHMIKPRKVMAVGSIHDTNNCGKIEIIELVPKTDQCMVRFLNTGKTKMTWKTAIRLGNVHDDSIRKGDNKGGAYLPGTIFSTKNYGDLEILGSGPKNMSNKIVRYKNTGFLTSHSTSSIKTGKCKDHTKDMSYKVGSKIELKDSRTIEVVQTPSMDLFIVKYEDGTLDMVSRKFIKDNAAVVIKANGKGYSLKIGATYRTMLGNFTILDKKDNHFTVRNVISKEVTQTTRNTIIYGIKKFKEGKVK